MQVHNTNEGIYNYRDIKFKKILNFQHFIHFYSSSFSGSFG